MIKAFEFCHELAWNVMKDYFAYQGNTAITGSRDAVREAFAAGLVDDGAPWMAMIRSRNLSAHTYNKKLADQLVAEIVQQYCDVMTGFANTMRRLVPA